MAKWFHYLKRLSRTEKGLRAEKIAKDYLHQQGLRCIAERFRSKRGEIDLVMQQQDTLVFVEVRYLASMTFVQPQETIDASKQQKLIYTANYYLAKNDVRQQLPSRFDVLALAGDLHNPHIEWIQAAF